jgi:hypothetical protein
MLKRTTLPEPQVRLLIQLGNLFSEFPCSGNADLRKDIQVSKTIEEALEAVRFNMATLKERVNEMSKSYSREQAVLRTLQNDLDAFRRITGTAVYR